MWNGWGRKLFFQNWPGHSFFSDIKQPRPGPKKKRWLHLLLYRTTHSTEFGSGMGRAQKNGTQSDLKKQWPGQNKKGGSVATSLLSSSLLDPHFGLCILYTPFWPVGSRSITFNCYWNYSTIYYKIKILSWHLILKYLVITQVALGTRTFCHTRYDGYLFCLESSSLCSLQTYW